MALLFAWSGGCETDDLVSESAVGPKKVVKGDLVNDTDLKDFDRAVVGLGRMTSNPDQAGGTGILVAPRLVLTAGHCGNYECQSQEVIDSLNKNRSVFFGSNSNEDQALEILAAPLEIEHPDYGRNNPTCETENPGGGWGVDLGFWVLDRPSTVALPYPVFGDVSKKADVTFYGFGSNDGFLRTCQGQVVDKVSNSNQGGFPNGGARLFTDVDDPMMTEGGDSGAPIFNEDGAIVGIHANHWGRDGSIAQETLPYLPWIEKTISQYRAELVLSDFDGDNAADLYFHNKRGLGDYADVSSTGSEHFEFTYKGCAGRFLTGYFDNDGRSRKDGLCIEDTSGIGTFSFASNTGELVENGWSRFDAKGWCEGDILVGDFNGDSLDDLFCRVVPGTKRAVLLNKGNNVRPFDYSPRSNWSTSSGWCGSNGNLYIGRFNSDNRDDLLCHWPGVGLYISYATMRGDFSAAHKSKQTAWCQNSGGAVLDVGDFNGDNWTDLYCRDAANNRMWIDYSSRSTEEIPFNGSNWSASNAYCNEKIGTLSLADMNGDGYTDLACHDAVRGIVHANLNSENSNAPFDASANWSFPNL